MPNNAITNMSAMLSPQAKHVARVVAVDWSGAVDGAEKKIWLAEVDPVSREVVRLEAGRNREALVRHLVAEASRESRIVVGLDFAFSLPSWFLESRGLAAARGLWGLAREESERWLAECSAPFWGRPGVRRPELPSHLRRADAEVPAVGGIRPKSAFQVGGAGAVGTGSLRGMPILATLREAGFAIWPFDDVRLPLVVEIYPRALTGPVVKTSPDARRRYLDERHPGLSADIRELAAGSDDAFDALVSALVMAEHADEFTDLAASRDPERRREGQIWRPRSETVLEAGADGDVSAGPDAPSAVRRRPNDSSKTRVGPVFRALAARQASEPQWLRRLLELAAGGGPHERPWMQQDLTVLEQFYEPKERGLQPPVALLSWLIRHFDPQSGRLDGDGEVVANRRRLAAGDATTIEQALKLLRTAGATRGWHVLEGPTYPDAFLVTPDALIVVEGKRTEGKPTTETTWMSGRHQMLRHLDAAWEIRGRRAVYGLLVVEGDAASGAVPEVWRRAAEEITSARAVAGSLPHRSADEQRGIVSAFAGTTTWQRVVQEFSLGEVLIA